MPIVWLLAACATLVSIAAATLEGIVRIVTCLGIAGATVMLALTVSVNRIFAPYRETATVPRGRVRLFVGRTAMHRRQRRDLNGHIVISPAEGGSTLQDHGT